MIGVIAPWNYPWTIPFGEVALALMAGNGVVLKPATLTPLLGERIVHVFERAGVPEGLVRTVHGPGTGPALVRRASPRSSSQARSPTGRGVGEECARQLKGSVLELGGKDPMIVLARRERRARDRGRAVGRLRQRRPDLRRASSGSTSCARSPSASSRASSPGAQRLRVGDPLQWDTEIGPMTSPRAVRDRRASSSTMRSRRRDAALRRARAVARPGSSRATSTRPPC